MLLYHIVTRMLLDGSLDMFVYNRKGIPVARVVPPVWSAEEGLTIIRAWLAGNPKALEADEEHKETEIEKYLEGYLERNGENR